MWDFNKRKSYEQSSGEQRRFHRIKMIIGLVCKRHQNNNINVFTDDVSVGGIKFFCHQPLEKKEDVMLEIPAGYGEYIRMNGTVAWIKQKGPHHYEGGINFLRLSDETQNSWKKFIRRNCEKVEDLDF